MSDGLAQTPESSHAHDAHARAGLALERLAASLAPRFEIVRSLGEGRASRVFLAREPALGRFVALKILRADPRADPVARQRFEREARSLGALAHPNIVPIHAIGELPDGTPYIVMQVVEGCTLDQRIAGEGPLSAGEARAVIAAVASALAAAHAANIVHRDVRPANVLCEEESGRVLLTDFGVAALLPTEDSTPLRLTQTGEALGDPEFMSPEQLMQGLAVSPASDVFGLGLLGYRLLTGRSPYAGESPTARLTARLEGRVRRVTDFRPDVDADLADLLYRCLDTDPARRPSARRIADRLAHEPDQLVVIDDDSPAPARLLASIGRRRMPQLVVLAFATGWAWIQLVDQLTNHGTLPEVFYDLSLPFVAAGISATFVLSWFHGARGTQRFHTLELWILAAIAIAWILVSGAIVFR